MKIISDPQRLLNLHPLVIYIAPAQDTPEGMLRALKRLNKLKAFTRGIFKFVIVRRRSSKTDAQMPELIKKINRNNLLVRLIESSTGICKYVVGKLDFNQDHATIEKLIKDFVTAVCELNAASIESRIEKAERDEQKPVEKLAELMQLAQKFRDAVSTKGAKCGLFYDQLKPVGAMRKVDSYYGVKQWQVENKIKEMTPKDITSLFGLLIGRYDKKVSDEIAKGCYDTVNAYIMSVIDQEPSPEVTVAIEYMVYRILKKSDDNRHKYGIKIAAGGEEYKVFFDGKDQQMLYFSALLRKKLGEKLYRHEFLRNSKGKNAKFKKVDSKAWFEKLYETIFPAKKRSNNERSFGKWFDNIEDKKGHPLDQAKSQANVKINEALGNLILAKYCCIVTNADDAGDSFFDIKIASDNIIIPVELQRLLDDFYDIMKIARPELDYIRIHDFSSLVFYSTFAEKSQVGLQITVLRHQY